MTKFFLFSLIFTYNSIFIFSSETGLEPLKSRNSLAALYHRSNSPFNTSSFNRPGNRSSSPYRSNSPFNNTSSSPCGISREGITSTDQSPVDKKEISGDNVSTFQDLWLLKSENGFIFDEKIACCDFNEKQNRFLLSVKGLINSLKKDEMFNDFREPRGPILQYSLIKNFLNLYVDNLSDKEVHDVIERVFVS